LRGKIDGSGVMGSHREIPDARSGHQSNDRSGYKGRPIILGIEARELRLKRGMPFGIPRLKLSVC